MRTRLWLALPAALLLAGAVDPAGERWWRYVRDLADDKFEGRATASEGHRRAAEYVAAEFKRLGLRPAGEGGYLQRVPLRVRRVLDAESSLTLVRTGIQERLRLGEDAYFNRVGDPPAGTLAPAAFVGYGLTVPELNYDDLAGIDLKGKVAVVLRGGPASVPGPMRAHYQTLAERWAVLHKAGAIGLATILDPRSMDIPWDRMKLLRLAPSMSLADPRFDDAPGLQLSLTVNPAAADRFFMGTGHSMQEVLAAAKDGKPLPKFPLAYSINAVIRADRSEAASENVAGILTGRDPRVREEYVVVSAHLDHLGTGAAVRGDSVYNGALDNAAGIASMFEVARRLRASRPRRSVLFLAVTAEEKGLLGSRYYAASPTVKPQAIVADLNLDMFQPLHGLRLVTVYGLGESSLGADVRAVAKTLGIGVQADPEPERNLFIRSDQYSFIRTGVPSLYLKFGFEKGSAEERIQSEWLRDRYHAPSDDAAQPVNAAAAARFNRLVAALAARVANATQRPRWNPDSFFRRFVRSSE